jgi:phenylpyruvate tautomerase PptA (4-oxalocrotonate tautomerase family)
MPLLRFYLEENTLSQDEKQSLVDKFTAVYTHSMPDFYVVVVFNEVSLLTFLMESPAWSGVGDWFDRAIAKDDIDH